MRGVFQNGSPVVWFDDGEQVSTRCLLIATGANYRKLDVPRREEFEGLGVYYAATQAEAEYDQCNNSCFHISGQDAKPCSK